MVLAAENENVKLNPFNKSNLALLKFWYCQVSSYGFATGGKDPENIILRQSNRRMNFFASGIYPANGENCIGLVSGEFKAANEPILWIFSFLIDKLWQRKRYGTNAFKLLIEYSCQYYHIKRVFVSVSAENKTGISFWKSLGFNCVKKLNITDPFYRHGVFILEKRL